MLKILALFPARSSALAFAALMVLVLVSPSSHAAALDKIDWTFAAGDSHTSIYVSLSSLSPPEGGQVAALELMDRHDTGDSIVALKTFQCRGPWSYVAAARRYAGPMAQGPVLESHTYPNLPTIPIQLHSLGDKVRRFVCSHAGAIEENRTVVR